MLIFIPRFVRVYDAICPNMDAMIKTTEGVRDMMKRMMIACLWLFLAVALFGIFANMKVMSVAAPKIVWPNALSEEKVDCIIVPGARVYADGTPCSVLKDRLDTGIDLYRAGVSDRLLLSGDHGTVGYDEVTAMKVYAVEQGVPEEDIFLDHAGFSTYETMYRAAAIFGAKSCVVVTQRYHLSRAVYLADKMDMQTYGVEADRESYQRIRYFEARESLARVKDVIFAAIKPMPTYLGDPISLTGDGRVTANAPFAMPILVEG